MSGPSFTIGSDLYRFPSTFTCACNTLNCDKTIRSPENSSAFHDCYKVTKNISHLFRVQCLENLYGRSCPFAGCNIKIKRDNTVIVRDGQLAPSCLVEISLEPKTDETSCLRDEAKHKTNCRSHLTRRNISISIGCLITFSIVVAIVLIAK